MTLPSVYNYLSDFDQFFIGYHNQFDKIANLHSTFTKNRGLSAYPPYNIRKIDSYKYVIELAIAGFSLEDIDIELNDGVLVVTGQKKPSDQDDYMYRGIAQRNFTRSFALNDHVEVKGAELVDGMLSIILEHDLPESKKPHKIPISLESSIASKKQLLTESA